MHRFKKKYLIVSIVCFCVIALVLGLSLGLKLPHSTPNREPVEMPANWIDLVTNELDISPKDVDELIFEYKQPNGYTYSNKNICNDEIRLFTKTNCIALVSDKRITLPNISSQFQGFRASKISLINIDTSKMTTMAGMFNNCRNLTALNLSNFNTSNVTDMQYMFNACFNLNTLNLSNFKTTKVTDMSHMFYDCTGLTSLNLLNLNTSNVTDMWNMFSACHSLSTLDLSSFDTSNVTNMWGMFNNSQSLTTIYVSERWIISANCIITSMFDFCGCDSVTLKG